MDKLIEGVLAVGTGLAPINRAGLVCDAVAVERHMLAVALHRQLLEIGGKPFQVLLVGKNPDGMRPEKVVVPDRQQTHQHRQIALERRRPEMLVHLVKAIEHRAEIVGAYRYHRRQADRRIHRVAAADPIPEREHLGGIDTEFRYLFLVRRRRNKMPSDRLFVSAQASE